MDHASCPALCPPTTSAVNHNVTETDYLAALYFQFSYWREMELQKTVRFNDTFINHRRRRIYLQVINMRHKFDEEIEASRGVIQHLSKNALLSIRLKNLCESLFPRVWKSNYISAFQRWWQWFLSAISNTCLTSLCGHSSKSKWITVMKVNKWNQIKQGHTSLEGQQMGTEMEVIFFPLVSQQKRGKKAISSGQKASCHFA